MNTKLLKSFAKTIIVSEKAKKTIANRINTAIEKDPQRDNELRATATLLNIEQLIIPKIF